MNSPMPEVDDDVLRQRVSAGSFTRGLAYAREGAVLRLDWDGETLSSSVAGTDPAPYRCRIQVVRVGTLWIPMAMGCSCPVRAGCKHAVATLVAARQSAREPAGGGDWRHSLTVLAPAQRDAAPLALGFYLRPEPGPSAWQNRLRPVLTEKEAYDQGKRLDLLLRPMTRGRSGAWIKGGLTWRGLSHELGHDPAALTWLRQLLGLYDGTRRGTTGVDAGGLALAEINAPLLWELLKKAPEAGVELVPDKGMTLRLAAEAEVSMQATRQGGALVLTPRVVVEGRTVTERWHPIGEHGIYTYAPTAGGFDVTLAPTAVRLPGIVTGLADPLTIPPADEQEFFDTFLPSLRSQVTIEGGDGADLPVHHPPTARLTVTVGEGDHLSLGWTFEYLTPRGTYALSPARPPHPAHRDPVWEAGIVDALSKAWPTWQETRELADLEAARFLTEVLPRLEQVDGVEVRTIGTPHSYTRLEGHPHVRITAVESDRTDWFDLGFEITINGHLVPFADLFAALSRGKGGVLLIDRSYLSLDHPAFEDLKRLLARAGELTEWEPERPRLSKYQVHMWEEFEDLADETQEAQAWRDAVAGLRNIDEIPGLPPPPGLHATLRPYQQVGLEWLAFLHRHRLGGILADDMGLGKTLQTLALIAHAAPDQDAPFLIVAPTSVVPTWVREAARFTPDLRVLPVTDTSRRRRQSLAGVAGGVDVVVTSYAIARIDEEEFTALTWAGLILDEAQFVKNPATRLHRALAGVPAPFRLAITGTPMENSLTDLWSLMSITAPGLFPSARAFREDYVRPIERNDDADRLADLRRLVRPFMLRRTKEQVAPELPPKQEQLLEVDLTTAHRRLYDEVLQRERQKVLGLIDDLDKNRFIVFRSLTLLRMLALAPGLVDEEHADIGSAKLATLVEHITRIAAEGHRVLVFSQFTSFLRMAARACVEAGLDYEYLDGSTTGRAEVIDRFRSGRAPVFFISLKAGGFGLTLTEADYVFVLDPWWNPAAESQAVDRTHRIGQTRHVMVYRLVSRGTIEEKVMALQARKAALFTAVVDDDAHFSRALSAADIRGLFD